MDRRGLLNQHAGADDGVPVLPITPYGRQLHWTLAEPPEPGTVERQARDQWGVLYELVSRRGLMVIRRSGPAGRTVHETTPTSRTRADALWQEVLDGEAV